MREISCAVFLLGLLFAPAVSHGRPKLVVVLVIDQFRAAILMGGQRVDLALWMDGGSR